MQEDFILGWLTIWRFGSPYHSDAPPPPEWPSLKGSFPCHEIWLWESVGHNRRTLAFPTKNELNRRLFLYMVNLPGILAPGFDPQPWSENTFELSHVFQEVVYCLIPGWVFLGHPLSSSSTIPAVAPRRSSRSSRCPAPTRTRSFCRLYRTCQGLRFGVCQAMVACGLQTKFGGSCVHVMA